MSYRQSNMKKPPRDTSLLSSVFRIFKDSSAQKTVKKTQQSRVHKQERQPAQSSSGAEFPYRAAEIVVEDCCCDAVRALSGTRFLLNKVPHIPLRDCTSRKCTCVYVRYNDRRVDYGDRRAAYSTLTNAYTTIGNSERRGSRGRRADDVRLNQ